MKNKRTKISKLHIFKLINKKQKIQKTIEKILVFLYNSYCCLEIINLLFTYNNTKNEKVSFTY